MGRDAPPLTIVPSFWGQVADAATVDSGAWEAGRYALSGVWAEPVDPAFEGAQVAAQEGYSEYAEYLSRAQNKAQYEWMVDNLHRKLEYRKRQAVSDSWVAGLIGGMAAPENALSMLLIPATGGASLLAGAGRAALLGGLSELPAEALRQNFDPTATHEEGFVRVAATTAFSGALGGFGGYLRGRARVAAIERDVAAARGTMQTSERVQGADGVDREVRSRSDPDGPEVDPVDGGVQVDDAMIIRGWERKEWRDAGLDDGLFPTPEAYREWYVRKVAEEAADDMALFRDPGETLNASLIGIRQWLDRLGLSDVAVRFDGWDDAVELTGARPDSLGLTFRGPDGKVTIALNPRIMEKDPGSIPDIAGRTRNVLSALGLTVESLTRHESVHALRRLGVIDDVEWAALVRRAKRGLIQEYQDEIAARYKGKAPEKIDEELVAELFRLDRVGNTVLDRIRRFVEGIVSALRGEGFMTGEMVIAAIERGEIGRRQRAAQMDGVAAMLPPTSSLRRALETGKAEGGERMLAAFMDPNGWLGDVPFFRKVATGEPDLTPLPGPQMTRRPFNQGPGQARWDSDNKARRGWIEGHRATDESDAALRKRLENSPPARLFSQIFKDSPLEGMPNDVVKLLGELGVLRPEDQAALLRLADRLGIDNQDRLGRDPDTAGSRRVKAASEHARLRRISMAMTWMASERGQRNRLAGRVPNQAEQAVARVEAYADKWFAELTNMGVHDTDAMIEAAIRGQMRDRLLSGGVIDIEPRVAQAVGRAGDLTLGEQISMRKGKQADPNPQTMARPGMSNRIAALRQAASEHTPFTKPQPRAKTDLGRAYGTPADRVRREQKKAAAARYEAALNRAMDEAREAALAGGDPVNVLLRARKEQLRQWLRDKFEGEPVTRQMLHETMEGFERIADALPLRELLEMTRISRPKIRDLISSMEAEKLRAEPRPADGKLRLEDIRGALEAKKAESRKVDSKPTLHDVLFGYMFEADRRALREASTRSGNVPGNEAKSIALQKALERRKIAGEMTEADFRAVKSEGEPLMDLAGAKEGRGSVLKWVSDADEMRAPTADDMTAAGRATRQMLNWQRQNGGKLREAMADAVEQMSNTPFKRVIKNALGAPAMELMQSLGDDGSMMTRLRAMGEKRGPSVFMRAAQWTSGMPSALSRSSEDIYVRYLGQDSRRVMGVETRFATSRGLDLEMRRADGSPAMSFEDFNRTASKLRMVGKRATREDHGEAAPFINEMIGQIDGFFETFRVEEERVGLLGGLDAPPKVAARLDALRQERSRIEATLNGKLTPSLRASMTTQLADMDAQIGRMEALGDKLSRPEQSNYFTRIFAVRAMLDHKDAVVPIIARALADAANADPAAVVKVTARSMMAEAGKVFRHITEGRADSEVYGEMSGTPSFAWARKLTHLRNDWMVDVDVGGKRVDFIETDPLQVAAMYAQRMGPHIEFNRTFKGNLPSAAIGFERKLTGVLASEARLFGQELGLPGPGKVLSDDDTLAYWTGAVGDRRLKGLSLDDHLARMERDIRIDKDRMLRRAVSEPDRWDNRLTGVLKSGAHMAVLGFAGWNSIVELGKSVFSHGFSATMPAAFRALDPAGRMVTRMAEIEAIRAGAIPEVALGAVSRLAEFGTDPINASRFETMMHRFTNRYFMVNMLGPITHGLKTLDSLIRISEIGDTAQAMTQGLATPEQLAKAQRYGMNPDMAARIAAQFEAHGSIDEGRWRIANTNAWDDGDAAQSFRAMLSAGVNNTVITASMADRPAVFDGVLHFRKGNRSLDALAQANDWTDVGGYWRVQSGLASMPFMYWAYGMGAMNKIAAPAIRMGTPRQMGGIVAMMGLAYLAEVGRVGMQGERAQAAWERMDTSDRLYRVLDRSGATGMMMDWLYTSRSIAEAGGLQGAVDAFDAIGMGPRYNRRGTPGSVVGDMMGPAPEITLGAMGGAFDMLRGDMGGIRDVGYALPTRNLPLISRFHEEWISALEDQ